MSWADEWAKHVKENRHAYRLGTVAHHKLGDVSRDEEDWFVVSEADADGYYVGHWLTGFGFINVRFPMETTRDATDEEIQWLADHPVVIA